ncbi:hypothetical protein F4Y93_13725 [Candidatus Poribacteria bacterium]|nr:hypothetical protein [Candidatus Poribacteria bacterium]
MSNLEGSIHAYRSAENAMTLVVLTHGLGATDEAWGSTADALRKHELLAGCDIQTWDYETSKWPVPRILQTAVEARIGRRRQSVRQLGEQLWSKLRVWSSLHDHVVLVGHSMGGLVSASSMVFGFTSSDPRDITIRSKICGLICVASPFGGAALARGLHSTLRPLAHNVQISDMRPKSQQRRQLVQQFSTVVLDRHRVGFHLFRASDDHIVQAGETDSPFDVDQYTIDVLTGGHSDCIHNLDVASDNLIQLARSIDLMRTTRNAKLQEQGVRFYRRRAAGIKEEYDKRLQNVQRNLDVLAWSLTAFREDYGPSLKLWVEAGVAIRLLVVSPHSEAGSTLCRLQDEIEGRGEGDTARDVDAFLDQMHALGLGEYARVIDYHPSVNVFRVDQELLFGPYLAGTVSRNAPTGIVQADHWLFDTLCAHFEWMWNHASAAGPSSSSVS